MQWETSTDNHSGKNKRIWRVYKCQNCGGLVVAGAQELTRNVSEIYPSQVAETFDFEYLKDDVKEDFQEALKCYSNNCLNSFAAMCRRTIQSLAEQLGAKGKDRVNKQIEEMRELLNIDGETYLILEQIIITGHDGAHPHLPKLSPERAATLLELMKDVLYQLCIRRKKIEESIDLRKKAIVELKNA